MFCVLHLTREITFANSDVYPEPNGVMMLLLWRVGSGANGAIFFSNYLSFQSRREDVALEIEPRAKNVLPAGGRFIIIPAAA